MKQRLEVMFRHEDIVIEVHGDVGSRGALKDLSYRHNTSSFVPYINFLEPLSKIRSLDELRKRLTKIADHSNSNRHDHNPSYDIKINIKPYQE